MFISFDNTGGQVQSLGSCNLRDRVRSLWRRISYCKSEPLCLDQELLGAEWSHLSLLQHLQDSSLGGVITEQMQMKSVVAPLVLTLLMLLLKAPVSLPASSHTHPQQVSETKKCQILVLVLRL